MGAVTMNLRGVTRRTISIGLVVIAVPLIANGLVAATFVAPQKAKLQAWRDAQTLAAVKPKLKELLTESHRVKIEQLETGVMLQDAQGAMQALQKSAGRNSVQIVETKLPGQGAQSEGTIPLELEVTGAFNKLARWMSEVESQHTFQINSWTLASAQQSQTLRLSIKMVAFVGGQ